jgi:peptide chain release factor 2
LKNSKIFKAEAKLYGGIFDFAAKQERLEEVRLELEQPAVWSDPDRAQALGQERVRLEQVVNVLARLDKGGREIAELLDLAREEDDAETVDSIAADLDILEQDL